jgi:uncharacterized membrane protein AbrB (regulator of aidB expression)
MCMADSVTGVAQVGSSRVLFVIMLINFHSRMSSQSK